MRAGRDNAFTSPCKGEVAREAGGRGPVAKRFARRPGMTERARRLRKEPTEAEKKLWRLLRRHQIEHLGFRRQHPVGNYVLDFYCPAMRLAVEVDGGQHGNAEECIGDERRTRWLTTKGIKLIRFWNNDVLDNIEGVWAVLVQEIERRRPRRPTPSLTLPLAGGGNAQEPPQRLRAGSG